MTGKLTRLSKSILEQPQLIMQSRFEEIAAVLDNHEGYTRLAEAAQLAHDKELVSSSQEGVAETTVGVLRIEGALTYKPTGFESLCGGASYQSLIEQTKQLCAMSSVNTILMDVNSGGGMAFRMMESAREIRSLCDLKGKRLIAYVDGISASAGYGLSSVAHEVIMNPESEVGSIGAVVRLVNTNQAEKDAGISTTYVTAGASKVPFDKEGEFREDYLADIQERITSLYDNFVHHVATTRDISEDVVRSTEAKMFSAEKALSLGLVDKVMEGEEFYTYLADISSDETQTSSKVNIIKLDAEASTPLMSTEIIMSDKEEVALAVPEASVDASMVAQLQEQKEQMQAQAELIAAFQAEKLATAKASKVAELSASLEQFSFIEDKTAMAEYMSNADESVNAMLNSVMASAQAKVVETEEAATAQIAEAQLTNDALVAEKEAVLAEKDLIKEEFGTKVNASEEEGVILSANEIIAAKVANVKAAKLAAKQA